MAQAVFISHGGGPMPLLGDPNHHELNQCLKRIAASINKPDAIVVVSAHWEAEHPTLTASAQPELLYDYYGFPPESYALQYPCPGAPDLARDIATALQNNGITAQLD